MDDVAFLSRVWDLDAMPSTDSRFRSAAGDIWQHRWNNHDWDDDWVFGDDRFDLLGCDDEVFLSFVVATIHPTVRDDPAEVERLVTFYNECLRADGWQLVPAGSVPTIGDVPRSEYEARKLTASTPRELRVEEFHRLEDPAVLEEHLQRIERSLDSDPAAAISASKSLVEAALKIILDDTEQEYAPDDDLLSLYKKVSEELRLRAESVPDSAPASQSAQKALRALGVVVQSLAEIRNKMGADHGRTSPSPALARHARLAASCARGLTEFLLETWHVRRGQLGSS